MMRGYAVDHDEEVPELTSRERLAFRTMLELEARKQWLWKAIKTWAFYVGSAITGAYAIVEGAQKWLPWFKTFIK